MSTMINIGPMVAKVIRDMLEDQGTILDVDSVYARLVETSGDEIFASERYLAEVAVRQKIKSHLRTAHSINGDDGGAQLSLLKDDVPAAVAVKQVGGGYAYVPLRMATIADIDAATKAKVDNIENATTALNKWTIAIKPIRAIMAEKEVTFGEAQKLLAADGAAEDKAANG